MTESVTRAANEWRAAARDLGARDDDPLGVFTARTEALAVALEKRLDRSLPIDRAELRKIALTALAGARTDFWRLLGWQAVCCVVAVAVLSGSIGAAGAWWWHGEQQLVAGVSVGKQECRPQDGGEICFIPVWAKLPPR